MASQANVRSIAALDEMNTALKRFQSDVNNVLRSTALEVKRTWDWLQERLHYWRNELQRRQQQLVEAQRALQACLRSGDGEHPPDCRQAQAYVLHMQRLVQEAQQELRVVTVHIKRIEEAIKSYQIAAQRFSNTLNGELLQGSAFLSNRVHILHSYASGGSMGGSSSGIGNTPSRTNAIDSISTAIGKALQSNDPAIQLEGTVANYVLDDVVSFQRDIGLNGFIGEIDVETRKAIIEVTTRYKGKSDQIRKYLTDPRMNPAGKAVILFAPRYLNSAAQPIFDMGAYVVRTKEELLGLLQRLGEK